MSAEVVQIEQANPRLSQGWEPLALLLSDPDFAGMIRAQHDEMGHLKEAMPLLVNWPKLLEAEAAAAFRAWVARVRGQLAGFIGFQIHVHPFHLGTVRAFQDVAYVAPKFRGKGLLYRRMWDEALADLKSSGVKIAMAHDNSRRSQEAFFAGLGFEAGGTIYLKAL